MTQEAREGQVFILARDERRGARDWCRGSGNTGYSSREPISESGAVEVLKFILAQTQRDGLLQLPPTSKPVLCFPTRKRHRPKRLHHRRVAP